MEPAHSTVPPALGEFRISAVLGQGGSGIVYDATWGPRRVALKVLHEELAGAERVRSQFLSEARALQGISHPSVVKVLGVGELPDRRPFLAMERLEGETLASVLARGPLDVAHALALFEELCEAVGALHATGLVHRDLKPENVFIVEGAHAVLLDLGIAKEVAAPSSTTTMEGGVRGTPAYMAPERFFGQPAGVPTDIYELAVTLYAMLGGQLPWVDLVDPEARLSPRPLKEVAPHIPDELDIEIRRALSTRAQNRPASAAVFRDAVRVALGNPVAPSPGSTARMKPAEHQNQQSVAHQPTVTAQKSWFAQRQQTTDRGKTPLAWAPADAPQTPPPPPPKRRWPFVAGGLAVAAIAGGAAWWRLSSVESIAPASSAASIATTSDALAPIENDPWGEKAASSATSTATEKKEIAATGEALAQDVIQKQIAHAMTRVPADTRFLFTLDVNALRKDDQYNAVLAKLANHIQVKALLATAPCLTPILAGSEWVVFGTQSLQDPERGTVVVGGRWKREDVVTCLSDDIESLKMPDGKTMLQLRRVGWVDFIDDHTVYISVREDLAAAQVHALVKNGHGGTKHTKELAAKLPPTRTLGAVIDGSGGMKWPSDALPKGSDAVASFEIGKDGWTSFSLDVDTKNETEALKLVEKVKAEVEPVFKDEASKRAGTVDVARVKTTMQVRGRLSPFIIGMVSTTIP
jgi:serine/threonine protein kinase